MWHATVAALAAKVPSPQIEEERRAVRAEREQPSIEYDRAFVIRGRPREATPLLAV
jgi:hypothetical protein